MALDSAIWVLEAALNYDFDQNLEGAFEYYRMDTLQIQIGLNGGNMKMLSDDLEDAYVAFSSAVHDSVNSDFEVQYIDVSGYVPDPADGLGWISIVIVKYATTYPVDCPTSGPFSPNANYKSMTNGQWGAIATPCGVTNFWPEAVSALNVYMNCRGVSHDCPLPLRRAFYVDLMNWANYDANQNGSCSTNPFSAELYHSCFYANYYVPNWWCNLSNHTISGMQLNSSLMNQISLANLLVSAPIEVVSRKIASNFLLKPTYDFGCNCTVGYPGITWSMDIVVGRFICSDPIE